MTKSWIRQGVVAFAALAAACTGDDSASSGTESTTGPTGATESATTATTTQSATASAGSAGTEGTGGTGGGTSVSAGTTDGTTDGTTAGTTDETTAGTTDGTGGDGALRELCLEVEDALEAGLSGDCQCEVEAGLYPSVAACFAEKGLIANAGQCRCDIYGEVPEMGPYLECLKPITIEFSECITSLGCEDPEALDICYFGFLEAGDCPASVKAAEAESQFECAGAEPFLCGSGEEIPDTWLCDLDDDCEDGSDESECPVFVCKSGDEIPEDWQCDGAEDCPDGDDEEGCDP